MAGARAAHTGAASLAGVRAAGSRAVEADASLVAHAHAVVARAAARAVVRAGGRRIACAGIEGHGVGDQSPRRHRNGHGQNGSVWRLYCPLARASLAAYATEAPPRASKMHAANLWSTCPAAAPKYLVLRLVVCCVFRILNAPCCNVLHVVTPSLGVPDVFLRMNKARKPSAESAECAPPRLLTDGWHRASLGRRSSRPRP